MGLGLAIPGYRTVCHVERDAYAAAVLVARMADEALGEAPVWDDLTTFDGRPWRGLVDIVSAGFPCQPWSAAGKRGGKDDSRWLWPDIARVVEGCQPGAVFLENSPRLDVLPILQGLASLGFDAAWGRFSASQRGAPHRRQRLFVLAYAHGFDLRIERGRRGGAGGQAKAKPTRNHWWTREPGMARVDDGTPYRTDRARALGNSVVPLVAAHAFRTLAARMGVT